MQYMLLIYSDPALEPDNAVDRGTLMGAYQAFNEDMKARGVLVAGDALQPTTTATTVRVRDEEVLHTDGPFAETKECLGGYYLIEAADLDEALEIAAKIPTAAYGSIEVRPLIDLSGYPQ